MKKDCSLLHRDLFAQIESLLVVWFGFWLSPPSHRSRRHPLNLDDRIRRNLRVTKPFPPELALDLVPDVGQGVRMPLKSSVQVLRCERHLSGFSLNTIEQIANPDHLSLGLRPCRFLGLAGHPSSLPSGARKDQQPLFHHENYTSFGHKNKVNNRLG